MILRKSGHVVSIAALSGKSPPFLVLAMCNPCALAALCRFDSLARRWNLHGHQIRDHWLHGGSAGGTAPLRLRLRQDDGGQYLPDEDQWRSPFAERCRVRAQLIALYPCASLKDIENSCSISSSYPGLPTSYVAEKIVRGMLLNERMVYVPKIFALTVWLLR